MKGNRRKLAAALIIGFIVAGLGIAGYLSGVLNYPEDKLYDLRVNLFARYSRPSDDIIVILLDQNSIDWAQKTRGWSWPWPREAYAEITDYMKDGGASSLAFDVLFSEPSVYGTRDDQAFVRAEADAGNVVQTVFFSTQAGTAATWPAGLDKPLFKADSFGPSLQKFDIAKEVGEVKAQFPIESLGEAAAVIGNVSGKPDSDNVVRRVRLFNLFDGKAVPGLSAASLLAAGKSPVLSYDSKKKIIKWDNYSIPVDKDGETLLRFRGSIDRYIPYPAWEILASKERFEGNKQALSDDEYLPPDNFKGKYVFFGFYAPGLYDIFNTPISSVYPGMGVHITMLDNMLQGDYIQECPSWAGILFIILGILFVTWVALYSKKLRTTVPLVLLVFFLIVATGLGSYQAGWWLPLAAPLCGALLAFIASSLYSYATEGSQKRFIKAAFSRYLAPQVVEQVIADPSKLNLGGEQRNMTAIFTDIQRFSSISEALQKEYSGEGPAMLVRLLNLYLTEMSDIILSQGGTIDKYEGDAIIAFFGAPIWTEEHAVLACRSALAMKRKEKELAQRVMDKASPFSKALSGLIAKGTIRAERPLYTRIGINSGDMVVGNMGTTNKMDYTIMGNAVNLASRLEGVNKQYNTSGILLSEYSRAKIGDAFVIRPLSRVRVVGISTPLRLYELLETKEDANAELSAMVEEWNSALALYEKQSFNEAAEIFSSIFRRDSGDHVAELYMKRCKTFGERLPEAWDGVDNLTEK